MTRFSARLTDKKVIALFLVAYLISILHGINPCDECWFLQVVNRVSHGETLYRDLFFGVTPLSIYIASLATSLFGMQLLVTKALLSLCFTCSVWLSYRIIGALKIGFSIYFIFALFAFSQSCILFGCSLYNPLANVFFLAALLVMLKRTRLHSFFLAGILAGLCFSSKQTTGLYLLACLLGSLTSKQWWQQTAVLFFGFLGVVVVFLIPIYLSGGLEKFLDYAWINKKNYLQYGTISYFDKRNFQSILGMTFIIPLFAYAGLLLTWWRIRCREAIILGLFLTGSLLGVFPRADAAHLTFAVPCLLLSLLFSWHHLRPFFSPKSSQLLILATKGWILCCFPFLTAYGLAKEHQWRWPVFSKIPHFQGILVNHSTDKFLRAQIKWIRANHSPKDKIFFLTPCASFYYLASGISNQTPFDFPFITTFGKTGIPDLFRTFSSQPFHIYMQPCKDPLWPTILEQYVNRHFTKKKTTFHSDLELYGSK